MTSILARVAQDGSPVVFIADSMKDGQIKAWQGGASLKTVGLDYYQSTQPLSEADAETLRKKYSKATGDQNVFIRQRLPRVYRVRPSIFGNAQEAPGSAGQSAKPDRSAAARAQYEADKRATESAGGTMASLSTPGQATAEPSSEAAKQLQEQMQDPRFAALVLKIADILKTSL